MTEKGEKKEDISSEKDTCPYAILGFNDPKSAEGSTVTNTFTDGPYSLSKKDENGFPLIDALKIVDNSSRDRLKNSGQHTLSILTNASKSSVIASRIR